MMFLIHAVIRDLCSEIHESLDLSLNEIPVFLRFTLKTGMTGDCFF